MIFFSTENSSQQIDLMKCRCDNAILNLFITMLKEVSKVASLISKESKKIVILQGAGVSVAADIPDFRTPVIGFYDSLKDLGLPFPEAIFDIDYFNNNPQPFYQIAHKLLPGKFKPTTAHYFARALEKKNKLLRLYTQNIDGLERLAGVSTDRLMEAHGHFRSSHCVICGKEAPNDKVVQNILEKKPVYCDKCGNLVKPDIVFYGENLPNRFFTLSDSDLPKCDMLIVMGTSLQVYPFASLANCVCKNVPRILINLENVESYKSDILLTGDCQNTINSLVHELGWQGLMKEVEEETKLI